MKGFAVHPKLDCPHLSQAKVSELSEFLLKINTQHFSEFECASCVDKTENWICLQCRTIACSRYVQGHMSNHHEQTKHSIALSFSDSSFWCYPCESYIDHPILIKARRDFSKSKFATQTKEEIKQQPTQEEQEKVLEEAFSKMEVNQGKVQEQQKATYQSVVKGLKQKKFKKIIFLTGAGLSVAAGIPDFRTPGTGLYSQLEKFNLPRPESVFQLTYYMSNPLPFIRLCKQWGSADFKPTDGHKFIKKVEEQNLLFYCMTQNIDDLETKAGVSPQKLVQAHGHSRSAHCVKCKKQASINDWTELIKKQEPLKCNDCGALVKPDIVFFGEQLPPQFFKCPQYVEEADLVFVIGTSLAVFPFAFLAHKVPPHVPLVLINNSDSLPQRTTNKIWMDGDIQENIRRICKDVEWTL